MYLTLVKTQSKPTSGIQPMASNTMPRHRCRAETWGPGDSANSTTDINDGSNIA